MAPVQIGFLQVRGTLFHYVACRLPVDPDLVNAPVTFQRGPTEILPTGPFQEIWKYQLLRPHNAILGV